jgi:hypothetical protein
MRDDFVRGFVQLLTVTPHSDFARGFLRGFVRVPYVTRAAHPPLALAVVSLYYNTQCAYGPFFVDIRFTTSSVQLQLQEE